MSSFIRFVKFLNSTKQDSQILNGGSDKICYSFHRLNFLIYCKIKPKVKCEGEKAFCINMQKEQTKSLRVEKLVPSSRKYFYLTRKMINSS